MSIRWSDLQPDQRPRSSSLPRSRPPSAGRRSSIQRSRSSSIVSRTRSPSPTSDNGRRHSDASEKHRITDFVAETFKRTLIGHNWPSPCELRKTIASGESYPFCLKLQMVDVLERQVPGSQENAEEGKEEQYSDTKGSTEYQLRTSLYDVTYKQFFGRTWVGTPVSGKPTAQKIRINCNQNVYFHTSLNDTTIVIVVEIVAVSHVGDGKMKQWSCGWGFFRPFKFEGDMTDLSSNTPGAAQRMDIYGGSPRSLLYIDEPIEASSTLSPVSGCQLLYSIQTHRHLARVMHLIPENVFVGANDVIPGLTDPPRDAKVPDPLRKPKQAKAMPCYIEKVNLSLTPAIDKLEEEMCRQLNEDHINQENKVADGTSVTIMERRLQVGVHNGWCYIDKPEVIHLGGDNAALKGSSLRRSMRGHQRTPSSSSIGSAVNSLIHRNRVQLDGMVEDPNLVVVFVLEYILSEPVADKRAGMAKASTFTVAVRWAAWNPFVNLQKEEQSVQLHGGPAPIPDSVLVFNGGDPSGSVASVSTAGSGTLTFDFKLQRKMPQVDSLAAPQLHDVPSLNLPMSARVGSQQSLNDNAELQGMNVHGRPPIPARGTPGLQSSGYQMSLTPHPETPLSHSAPVHGGPSAAGMYPSAGQVYAQPGTGPYSQPGTGQYSQPGTGPYGPPYGQSFSGYGSPYGGVGPYSPAPVYHPSPRGYIPVEITHLRDQMSPWMMLPPNTARTTGDLQELPFTPVHAPIMATVPGRHSGQGLSRSAYAKLYTAGFPPILDNRGEPPEVVDPSEPVPFNIGKEEVDKLQGNEIVFQFLAYSRVASMDMSAGVQKPATVFFTFQFYRFPQVTTERLMLGNVEGDLSSDPNALPCLLQKLGKDGAVINGPPGFQVKYHVDPAYLKPGEGRLFVEHMSQQTIFIDVWDGDSLMLIGSCGVELKHLCRQAREAVQVTYELDVMATEYIESEVPIPAGDVTREGIVRPVDVKNVLKGRLHLRLANIGHPTDSKLTRTERGALGVKPKKVISAETGADSRYAGGSLSAPPTGDHASVLRKTRVAKAAHMTEVDHELASILYTRKEKLTGTVPSKGETNKAQQRKLARMTAVRQAENEAPQVISTYRAEKEERSRDLKTIDLYRSQTKRDGILNMLNSAITSEHTINPSLGTTEFFEFVLRNPYNIQHTVIVDCDDPELRVVTDPREWRHYKMLNDINTPVEEGMFNMDTQSSQPEVFLRPKEYVSIPFKFLTMKADHSVQPQAPSNPFMSTPKTKTSSHHLKKPDPLDSRVVKVFFKTQENKPIAILSLKVDPQPHVIDQTFRFHHPEQSFLKKSVRLPPLHTLPGMPIGGGAVSQVFVRCSDANVITDSRQVQQGEPHDVFMKVACGASPQVKKFFLVLYTDPFLSRPLQIWQVFVHALQRVDVAATEGQTSRFTLILRGTQASRLVQCFSSHADELQTEPREPFMLAANALQEVHVGVRPHIAGTKFLYINVVDIEYHQMVRTWLVCVNCRAPMISKAYELSLPVGGGKGSNKRIAYTNPYPHKKIFHLRSNRDDLLQFKDTRLEVGPAETVSFGLRFAPSQAPGTAEILVFINDDTDKNEETFCVRASYQL